MYVKVSDLPTSITSKLQELGYFKKDIEVKVKESMRPARCAFEGNRAVFTVVNIGTGQSKTEIGSWGGSNPFECKPLDHANEAFTIPPNCAVISGENGGRGCFLRLYLSSTNVIPALETTSTGLTFGQARVLYAHKGLKPAYRKEAYDASDLPAMVEKGFIKQTKVGTQITTEGWNAWESWCKETGNSPLHMPRK